MAPNPDADGPSKSASKKKRKAKKKAADKAEQVDDVQTQPVDQDDDDEEGDEHPPDASRSASVAEPEPEHAVEETEQRAFKPEESIPVSNGTHAAPPASEEPNEPQHNTDIATRLDAAERDRESLRSEVAELRKSLEGIQTKHETDLAAVTAERDDARAAKEKADAQYQTLLGRVNTIRSQLGDRLKADAEELSQARSQIEQLEQRNAELKRAQADKGQALAQLQKEVDQEREEINSIRSRANLSTNNWVKERDDLNSQLAYAREEFENAKQAMQDWEVLAVEERSVRENLGERMAEIEEQAEATREAYERTLNERDVLNQTVEGLQRALQEIQQARKVELREAVETSQAQLNVLRKQADEAAKRATDAVAQLDATQKELERALPFEREVKEKNLLIGKLRHEAVILNDHLTKALRFLKRGKPEDNVDRQIVTNHFLHFLALDRTDPKKFQILQLIAALLGWSDEQREQAGLSRPGASNISLRVPLSPFRRTPSTPSLSTDLLPGATGGGSRESLAELWSEFLEREAEAGGGVPNSRSTSRRGSVAQSTRSASLMTDSPGGLGTRATGGNNHVHQTPVPEEEV